MNIRNFIDSINEKIIDSSENITDDILTRYIEFKRLVESDEEIKKAFTIKISDALTALSTLKLYEEQQTLEVNSAFTKLFKKHEKKLLNKRKEGQQQRDIREFFEDELEGFERAK